MLTKYIGDFEGKSWKDSEKGNKKETGRSTWWLRPKDAPGKPDKKD